MHNIYTRQDIITLNNQGALLLVANNKVYDVHKFLSHHIHPGGDRAFILAIDKYETTGQDATKDFNFHSTVGKHQWNRYCVGTMACECPCTIM